MTSLNSLREYLDWLITPQNNDEAKRFKEEGLVDDYISIKNRIPEMTREELIEEINVQLRPYGKQIDKS